MGQLSAIVIPLVVTEVYPYGQLVLGVTAYAPPTRNNPNASAKSFFILYSSFLLCVRVQLIKFENNPARKAELSWEKYEQ
jgi:hypothetical protein